MTPSPPDPEKMLFERPPVSREAVSDQIFQSIREAILSLQIRGGTRLTESRLAADFQVSTTPIREALQRLQQIGLVDKEAPRGVRVHRITPAEIRDVYQLRMVLEPLALRQSIPRFTKADVDGLFQILDQAKGALENDEIGTLNKLNGQFHLALIQRSENHLLRNWLESLKDRHRLISAEGWAIDNRKGPEWDEHRAISEAVRHGDAERAAELLEKHIRCFAVHVLDNTGAAPTEERIRWEDPR